MKTSRLLIVLLLIFPATYSWAAKKDLPILLMDTMEYNYVQSVPGKRFYVHRIAEVLRSMDLTSANGDLSNISDADLALLIQDRENWSKIVLQVQDKCLKPAFEKRCQSLARIRMETFDYIKRHSG